MVCICKYTDVEDQDSVVEYVVCLYSREYTVVCGVNVEGTMSGVYMQGSIPSLTS